MENKPNEKIIPVGTIPYKVNGDKKTKFRNFTNRNMSNEQVCYILINLKKNSCISLTIITW